MNPNNGQRKTAYRTKQWKLIHDEEKNAYELYDLDKNSQETTFDGEKYGYDQSYIDHGSSPLWRKRLNDILKLGPKSGRLLDIGCNYGFFLRVCEPQFDTYGIDASQYAISQARNYAPDSKLLLGDIQKGLSYNDETFDVVTMFDTLEHIANYKYTLKEVYRILKRGGIFTLTTPNRWSLNSILFGKDYWFKRDSTHVVLFSKDSLMRNLSETGFTQIKIRTISFLHFLGDFSRRSISPEGSPELRSAQKKWGTRIPPPVKPLLGKAYNLINNPPTPWGANLYAFCKK